MRVVLQRVSQASVSIDNKVKSAISKGLLLLLGIEPEDRADDIEWLCKKIVQLRIFNDADEKMNLSLQDIDGEILIVSQFTLFAKCKKGNRPSFVDAARPDIAIPLYNSFLKEMEYQLGKPIGSGEFGADMKVQLINDGPVTILFDTKNKDLF
jgi:D-tyrosyl-tRNA(Tyr) deacylase